MNLRSFLFALAGVAVSADAYAPLSKEKATKATNFLNSFRRSTKPQAADMHAISYDYESQKKLDAIIESNGPRWMFEVNPSPPFDYRQNINGYFIGEQIGMSLPFWGWHDTCSALGQGCILKNFAFRFNQYSSCFNYSNCNATTYNRFKSCETPLNEIGSGSECSYAWVYMGVMLRANITRMACAVLEVPGWKPPSNQLNSYWCFTDGGEPSNDLPYKAGKAGSDCTRVKKRLCV